ncbi:acetyl-CoA carboxylase biotin carboxyl carrier protein subunit [Pedobacter sp. GR22-10]|uniref:acetyl-CoA carboxylase biotin carboxyl carrier protein subunit n=1 Tax=Pedobacter sp. GR22-10 TaxID=2994472 RepID=UPI002245D6DF|nr:acetyl-CoA carboxylase biotin carboxyl carrier protein subunit [Pedobacter sp. GR22-10]MCX2431865.1 acetyl-CoA carboxylase biotin carboxyl carrier protein subunit [Pedobacter sp. GR22-10]
MDKIEVNKNIIFNISGDATKFHVNDQPVELDLIDISASETHILYRNQSFNVEVVEVNQQDKTCKVKVNGTIYQTKVEDRFDQLLKNLGMDNLNSNKVLEMKAPMPGMVLKVLVNAGDEVKKGDNLLILEAMKMENILKSTTDGTVSKVLVKQGDKVEKNQILIQFK